MAASTVSSLGIIGGTGKLGSALARRWVSAGHEVILGSRDERRAAEVAAQISTDTGRAVRSAHNLAAAGQAGILVVTVPFAAQRETLLEIREAARGKIVVDTTVPLVPPRVMRVQLPDEGSAALIAQAVLGEGVRLVSAFHSVAAHKLALSDELACDVMVFGDDKEARRLIAKLADDAGLRGIEAGPLANAVAAEALTSVLIVINKTYSVDGAGSHFTGALIEPR
jgi:NADPH-dependent F420 reductase